MRHCQTSMIIRRYFTLITVLCILYLSACTMQHDDLQNFTAQALRLAPAPIPAVPELQKYSVFVYSALEKRSPFVTPEEYVAQQQLKFFLSVAAPNENRAREVLEEYEFSTLSMVGVVRDIRGTFFGLVQSSDGIVHSVQVGNYLGHNHGEVIEVTSSKIKIRETVQKKRNFWINRDQVLKIKRKSA